MNFKTLSVLCIGIAALSCSDTGTKSHDRQIENIRLTKTDLSGWHETNTNFTQDGYLPFDSLSLFDIINGGASEFSSRGLKKGFVQEMKSDHDSDQVFDAFAMDFQSEESARAMYQFSKSDAQDVLPLPNVPTSTGFWVHGMEGTGNGIFIGYQSQFYFEISLVGVQDSAQGLTSGEQILRAYLKKAK